MNKKLSVLRRITAVVLCVTLLSSQVVVANAEDSERMNVQTNSEITDISEQDGFSSDTSEISDITESDIPDSFEGESEPNTDISSEVTEEFGNSEDQGFTDGEETIIEDENTSDTLEEANPDYEDGKICIYNYQQLLQIGTGTQMFSGDKDGNVGEGDKVLADGAELTYASDASYCLMNDIPIDNENVWNFPSDFTGSITSSSERTGNTVYDSVTDTIYVYNRYQLELMKGESSDSEPVMSEDYIAEKVGMGQVFTLEDGSYLTYSKTHNYVLASSFTTETPELLANKAGTEETTQDITSAYPSDYEGRNYFGQVVKKIGDKNYILIGNETQLRAIGTDTDVTEPIWRVYETREKKPGILGGALSGYTAWKPAADTQTYKTELYYPGDADIVKFNDTYNWSGKELYGNKKGDHKLGETEYLDNSSLDIAGTTATKRYVYVSSTIQESADMTVTATDSTASASEAASVEAGATVKDRDLIDMTPVESEEVAESESDDIDAFTSDGDESDFTDDTTPESITVDENKTYILTYDTSKSSNTNIAGSGYKYSKDANYIIFRDIDLSKEGTNSNGKDDNWTPIKNFQGNMEGRKGMTEGANVKISNVKMVQDTAINQSAYSNGSSSDTEYGVGFFRSLSTPYDSSLQISSKQVVVKNLTLSGVSVSTTTNSIKKDFSLLGVVLTRVLKILGLSSGLEKDPKSFSTGAFAGVVKGNVQISDCHVEGLSGVSNANSWTGGFVGYISGITKYEALSGVLKGVTDALSTLLNLIPVLGLGDLITTLLNGGVLSVGNLIPIGYVNPVFSNCSVSGNDTISGQNYTGGFAGETIGAVMTGCSVNGTESVNGTDYSGGFIGRASNAVVAGALDHLGIQIADFPVNTVMLGCSINGSANVSATGSSGKESGYAGGFIGEMRNSYAVNCSISSLGTVSGKDYTGGFAGLATLGAVTSIDENKGLLDLVKKLLTGLLNGNITDMDILNLVGLRPSVISGCTIDGSTISLDASGKYAGGLVGYAGAVQVSNTSELADGSKSTTKALNRMLAKNSISYSFNEHSNSITASESMSVSATENAGGILGYAKMTSVSDVLGGTVTAADYMRFECKDCSVNGGSLGLTVTASNQENGRAGGAIGYGTGGEVRKTSVTNLNSVTAGKCAGGFAGYFGSGTLEKDSTNDADAGSAGGFIGCGTGVQISNSDVNKLQHTGVSEPKNLQQEDGSSYYGSDSAYAVNGYRYAGGYIGKAAMGSTAAIGGASVLDKVLSASNLLSALTVVASIIDSSDVYGATGGFNVLATDGDGDTGKAGGYAGELLGVQIQNSNSYNFAHIIGRESAGGYVGTMEPGSAADVVDGLSALGGLIKADNLFGVLQAFVPVIKNSETTCVPCGGAVRAQAESDDSIYRGLAGGYAGYNYGGQIWGNNTDNWKGSTYAGTVRECAAYRIRSVYGTEYAGGYTGLMRCANVADTGSLKVLFGLIKLDNPLTLLQAVYPTEKNTAVYGPLRGLDTDTWNKWVGAVGSYGSYGNKLQALGEVNDQEQLNEIISQYAYGYAVTAGRSILASKATQGGSAGGYVGRMEGGTVTNGTATDLQSVEAFRSSGGFAGEMLTGSVANTGDVSLAGLKIIGADGLAALKTFVPVVKQSHVDGYRSGARIKATGIADKDLAGFAGGYVGRMIGGQIWGDENTSCSITNLRRVDGTSYVGGFAGKVDPGSVAAIDTATKQGLLNKLLDVLMVNAPAELIKVLNATVSTIRCASVSAWDDWGVIVNGTYQNGSNTGYAKAAGGFAGSLCGAVLGEKDTPGSGIRADKIRSVVAGEYAGGCFGIADVSGAANISAGNETSVLQYLLKLGKTDVLDAFRSYVYYGNVTGSPDAGLGVSANTATKSGQNNEVTYSGTAGGFGGSLLNGSVKNSSVMGLNYVTGLNSVGGFVGYSGKSGVVKMEKLDVLGDNAGQLLGGALGVLDIFGSHIDDSSVTGIPGGYTVQSKGGDEQIAGGFIGYANLARMSGCNAGDAQNQENSLKLVESGGTAGGFAGRTSFAYLADVKLDSTVVDALLVVLNQLVQALYLDKIQDSNLLHINLGIVKVDALYEGNLLHVNLLGLDISVGLSKKSTENNQQTDLAIIKIGDSSIKLPCDKDGIITKDNDVKSNISINLIKANRTKITDSSVYGISTGYDVYAGGAGNDADGSANDGRSGGFVGYNDEGLLKNNNMYYCDVVRGTSKLVGPFSGKSDLDSAYDFNTKAGVEGENNNYRIYRKPAISFDEIKKNSKLLTDTFSQENGWSIFSIKHVVQVDEYNTLQNAVMATKDSSETADLNAYISDAKAVLMSDAKTTVNTGDSTSPEPSDTQDPCDENVNLTINKVWKDFRNMDNLRPDSITVTISRSWTDAEGTKQTEVVPGYENYEIKGDISKSTWQKVIETLPAYIKDDADKTHYYEYSVTETEINGYTTTIKSSDDGFTFTIINRHFALLPDTGGKGIMMFIVAGGLLLAFLLYTGRRRKRKQTM